ncbi:protein of unknown function [Clostridium cavendishii DSM 21758]|uniref:DUF4179 domain-containing protein n=1 Tax=Clostridium cavendishii DSM 21758 TaxID=1121302 RepID=A0A1M6VS56_9CLOT|nr:DUF4179 domain-containing protein [Clostridium cavendishii]SHK84288.1 protein of unknown function [Clostridium cavendishii DSM 21758]
MDDILKDSLIREKLKEENELPDVVNISISEALDNINGGALDKEVIKVKNKRRGGFIKTAVGLVIILGASSLLLNDFGFIAYAKANIQSVFGFMEKEENSKYYNINENLEKYSTKSLAKAKDKDITINLTNVIVEDNIMKVGYVIEGKKINSSDAGTWVGSRGSVNDNVYLDGEKANILEEDYIYKCIDENTMVVMKTLKSDKKFKEKFDLKFEIKETEWTQKNIQGSWCFDLNIDSNVLLGESKRIDVNKHYKIGEVDYEVKSIVYYPTGLYVNLKGVASSDYNTTDENGMVKALIITDENGVIIQGYRGLAVYNNSVKEEIEYKFYGFVDKLPKEFNIIPVRIGMDNRKAKTYEVGKKIDITNLEKINIKCN